MSLVIACMVRILHVSTISVRYKFQSFVDLASQYLDVIIIAETKLDDIFPTSRCHINGFKNPMTYHINNVIDKNTFPDNLKKTDVSPVFKIGDPRIKENFRPISILSTLSKVFEKLMHSQMLPVIRPTFSDLLCGFREGYSTQHALIKLVEHCRAGLDDKNIVGMVLMGLLKAYDCLPNDLLIAKLKPYGFGMNSLQLLYSYITARRQRIKINSTHSSWLDITSGVPQGSVL